MESQEGSPEMGVLGAAARGLSQAMERHDATSNPPSSQSTKPPPSEDPWAAKPPRAASGTFCASLRISESQAFCELRETPRKLSACESCEWRPARNSLVTAPGSQDLGLQAFVLELSDSFCLEGVPPPPAAHRSPARPIRRARVGELLGIRLMQISLDWVDFPLIIGVACWAYGYQSCGLLVRILKSAAP